MYYDRFWWLQHFGSYNFKSIRYQWKRILLFSVVWAYKVHVLPSNKSERATVNRKWQKMDMVKSRADLPGGDRLMLLPAFSQCSSWLQLSVERSAGSWYGLELDLPGNGENTFSAMTGALFYHKKIPQKWQLSLPSELKKFMLKSFHLTILTLVSCSIFNPRYSFKPLF